MGARQSGISIIELMIAVTIMGILFAIGLPSFKEYLANLKVRASAEGILEGLQNARGEAVKRNGSVEFLLTDADPIAANVAGNYTAVDAATWIAPSFNWIVRTISPLGFLTGKRAQEGGGSGNPVQVQAWADINRNNAADAGEMPISAIAFGSFGNATFTKPDATSTAGPAIFRFTNPVAGTCKQSGGPIRCLQIVVSSGGQARLCDPAVTAVGDTRAC